MLSSLCYLLELFYFHCEDLVISTLFMSCLRICDLVCVSILHPKTSNMIKIAAITGELDAFKISYSY